VVIDDREITYVGVVNPDVFVVMSQEAYDKLIGEVKEGGRVFYDSDLVKIKENPKLRQISIPSTSAAKDLGRQMVANVVMLGAMVEGTRIVEADQLKGCLQESVPPGTEQLNLKAFDKGRALFKG
jgi:2-oxoglutarate ferredoxin oxidoreductase subunit gamma